MAACIRWNVNRSGLAYLTGGSNSTCWACSAGCLNGRLYLSAHSLSGAVTLVSYAFEAGITYPASALQAGIGRNINTITLITRAFEACVTGPAFANSMRIRWRDGRCLIRQADEK